MEMNVPAGANFLLDTGERFAEGRPLRQAERGHRTSERRNHPPARLKTVVLSRTRWGSRPDAACSCAARSAVLSCRRHRSRRRARRLAKEMAKCDADIARVDQKLGNADFLKRAPEEVVEGEREKRAEAQARKPRSPRRWSGSKAPRDLPSPSDRAGAAVARWHVLRLPILAVPPVIPALRSEFGLSGTEIGILTSLPVILFAAAAMAGSRLVAGLAPWRRPSPGCCWLPWARRYAAPRRM